MEPVGLANTSISTGYAQKSPRSLIRVICESRYPTPVDNERGEPTASYK